jgi:hypothetical protein
MLTAEGKKHKEELEARIAARVEAFKIEQRELLEELTQAGVKVDMVHRLPNVPTSDYRHAIPILMKHLRRDYSVGTVASLARSLATKEAQEYWDEFVAMYKESSTQEGDGAGDVSMALAAAVAASCPPKRMSELVDLLRDRRLPYRAMLLGPLRKKRGKDAEIAHVLDDLCHDPELATEINSWKVLPAQVRSMTH